MGGGTERAVWARGQVAAQECPVSYVTGDSMAWLEYFYAQEALGGGGDLLSWPARRVDAMVVLKVEMRKLETERDARS